MEFPSLLGVGLLLEATVSVTADRFAIVGTDRRGDEQATIFGGVATLTAAGVGVTCFGLWQMGSMYEYNASVSATRAALNQSPDIIELIRYATLAANSHNTQPWRFKVGDRRIDVLPDMARQIAIVDPDNHHLFVSLGCAAENLAIACGAHGKPGELRFDPTE